MQWQTNLGLRLWRSLLKDNITVFNFSGQSHGRPQLLEEQTELRPRRQQPVCWKYVCTNHGHSFVSKFILWEILFCNRIRICICIRFCISISISPPCICLGSFCGRSTRSESGLQVFPPDWVEMVMLPILTPENLCLLLKMKTFPKNWHFLASPNETTLGGDLSVPLQLASAFVLPPSPLSSSHLMFSTSIIMIRLVAMMRMERRTSLFSGLEAFLVRYSKCGQFVSQIYAV